MKTAVENSINRTLVLKASLDKAWNAIATPEGFSCWFSSRVEGEWKEGQSVLLYWPSGNANEILLSKIEPKSHFAYQWHPGAYAKLDDHPASELTTVSVFLKEVDGGTEMSLIESGFENIPDDRRLEVLGLNSGGWDEELENFRKYVEA